MWGSDIQVFHLSCGSENDAHAVTTKGAAGGDVIAASEGGAVRDGVAHRQRQRAGRRVRDREQRLIFSPEAWAIGWLPRYLICSAQPLILDRAQKS